MEIGALHEPAPVPEGCEVVYFDVRSRRESVQLFDELDAALIVDVDEIGDVDRRDLRRLGKGSYDFVIANHVIEHLANPIALVEDMFHITKPGGVVVISAPDKRFTFDKKREITHFQHLLEDFWNCEERASDSHYLEFIRKVLPGGGQKTGKELAELLDLVWRRREHVHVWDSGSFRTFLTSSLDYLGIEAIPELEIGGDETRFEYFSIWRKENEKWYTKTLNRIKSILRI